MHKLARPTVIKCSGSVLMRLHCRCNNICGLSALTSICCSAPTRYFPDCGLLTRQWPVTTGCYHPHSKSGIIFSSVRLCVCVCLSSAQDNSWTVRDFIMKFSGHHHKVERADKFENGRAWVVKKANVSDVLVLTLTSVLSQIIAHCIITCSI